MPTTLHKTRKQISKKRNGVVNALHEKSRDSMRLHKAGIRDQRLEKLASNRNKREQPIVERVAFFQDVVRENGGGPLEVATICSEIRAFVSQYDEEYHETKKARRPGRPPSAREDLLRLKIAALEAEYKQGFTIPDVTTVESVTQLQRWEGNWAFLTTLPWIKVTSEGQSRKTDFPSKGIQ